LIILLTGLAGSGKTEVLHGLEASGEQVLDLELLARHRGSAFGGMGLGPQPSHASFQAALRAVYASVDPARPLWVEAEGHYIGSVGLPLELQNAMAHAPQVGLVTVASERVRRIVATYGDYPLNEWLAALARVEPRLGQALSHSVRTALTAGAIDAAVELLLKYYDGAYSHRIHLANGPLLGSVDVAQPHRPASPSDLDPASVQAIVATVSGVLARGTHIGGARRSHSRNLRRPLGR